jgi:putative membrane protein
MNIKLITAVAVVLQTAALGALAQDSTRPGSTQAGSTQAGTQDGDKTGTSDTSDAMKDKAARAAVNTESFVHKAALADMTEIELGQLALQKSQDPGVREFAQRMVKDHTASSAKLKAAAMKEGVAVPATLDSEHQKLVQRLQALNGTAFDAEFSKIMDKDHHKAVKLFESASQSPQVAEPVREFAQNTLPTLKTHRQLAEALDEGAKHDRDHSLTDDR